MLCFLPYSITCISWTLQVPEDSLGSILVIPELDKIQSTKESMALHYLMSTYSRLNTESRNEVDMFKKYDIVTVHIFFIMFRLTFSVFSRLREADVLRPSWTGFVQRSYFTSRVLRAFVSRLSFSLIIHHQIWSVSAYRGNWRVPHWCAYFTQTLFRTFF